MMMMSVIMTMTNVADAKVNMMTRSKSIEIENVTYFSKP